MRFDMAPSRRDACSSFQADEQCALNSLPPYSQTNQFLAIQLLIRMQLHNYTPEIDCRPPPQLPSSPPLPIP